MEVLSNLSLVHWLIGIAVYIIITAGIVYSFVRWVLKRLWRLYCNLKRQVIIMTPRDKSDAKIPATDMENEIDLLKKTGFLKIELQDYRSYDPSGKQCILVIGYHHEMAGLDDLLNRIKTKHIPLIVYTYKPIEIPKEIKEKIYSYPYSFIANFPITLMNHIFATAASFPYKSK